MGLESLQLMHAPAASFISFGIVNWVWANIAMWAAVLIIFCIGVYARIPEWMEMDADERAQYQHSKNKEE
ncbi:hypothetical protein [Acidihalobacter ferrooxydans]|uniref:Uncharacterized protein n=1 Tax=Acidihalobacter ferrooxydans TaxID=1765967 RepID=A0A1P8UDC6_9GAMM|nr:hypothetical protein [Acidihalobacter ferrooxydans]APZ41862.1 hypothetical protein BW247_01075 [Acidihalobacter ferrooxydans]